MTKPVPFICPSCEAETPPSYNGRLVWLDQIEGPVVCTNHRDPKDKKKVVPVEMLPVDVIRDPRRAAA